MMQHEQPQTDLAILDDCEYNRALEDLAKEPPYKSLSRSRNRCGAGIFERERESASVSMVVEGRDVLRFEASD